MKNLFYLLIFAYTLCLASCGSGGHEVGRISIDKLSSTTYMNPVKLELELKKDQNIKFWSDIEMYYEDEVDLNYKIKIMKDNRNYGSFSFDPRDNRKKSTNKMQVDSNEVHWKVVGIGANYVIPEDAIYTFEVALVIDNNQTFRINHADLIIKR